jgi:hypothetical protein
MKKFILAWSVLTLGLVMIALLGGCGSVGSSASPQPTATPTPNPSPSPTPPGPTPPPSPTPTTAAQWTIFFVNGVETPAQPTDEYRLNADGTLSLVAGSPFPITGLLATSGNFLMVANTNSLSAYRIDPATGVPAISGNGTVAGTAALAADARDVYVVGLSSDNANNVIYGLSVAASGILTPLSGSPFLLSGACAMCNQPVSMAVNNNFILVGTCGFHGAGGVLVLPSAADGTLGKPLPGGIEEQSQVALQQPAGNAAFGIDGGLTAINSYLIDSTGKPASASFISGDFMDEVVDPTGKFLLATGSTGVVHVFSINAATAAISQIGTSESVGSGANLIAMDPGGRFVIVTQASNLGIPPPPDQITVFTFDPASGAMKKLPNSYPVGKIPVRITVVAE